MGFLQKLGLAPSVVATPEPIELVGPIFESLKLSTKNMTVEQIWEDQPHLRTVTTFIARNVASLQLQAFERVEDGGRERVREGHLARVCKLANADMTMYDLLERTMFDLCLYDEFFWLLPGDLDVDTPTLDIRPIPVSWVQKRAYKDGWGSLDYIVIESGDNDGRSVEVPGERVIHRHGYNPKTMKRGKSPVQSLRDILGEQIEAAIFRAQMWRNGPRPGMVIMRDPESKAGRWDAESRTRFMANLRASFSPKSSDVGGTLLLEDGMKAENFHTTSKDEQTVETTKLSLQTVAQVYGINPTMVGQLDNANYSNVREFRKALYGDNLGSWIRIIQDVMNLFLLPRVGVDNEKFYFEFNLEEKLRASFEEAAEIKRAAVGNVAWMTINEVRAMDNLPSIDGGDELARPLNTEFGDSEEPPGEEVGA